MAKRKNKVIQLPHLYRPLPYQGNLYDCLANGYKRGVAVWHRRAGKDLTLLVITINEMFKRKGLYYYFYPFFKQARAGV